MKPLPKILSLASAGFLLAAHPAFAQIVEYTSQAAYNAASFSYETASFDASAGPDPTQTFDYGSQGNTLSLGTVGGSITFSTPSANTELFAVGGDAFPAFADTTTTLDPQGQVTGGTATLNVGLPTVEPFGVTSVGTEIGSFTAAQIQATVTLANGTSQTFNLSSPNVFGSTTTTPTPLGFLGFTSTGSSITGLTLVDSTDDSTGTANFLIDNFTYGISNAVPEPSSLSLLVLGGLSLVGLFFRSRRSLS